MSLGIKRSCGKVDLKGGCEGSVAVTAVKGSERSDWRVTVDSGAGPCAGRRGEMEGAEGKFYSLGKTWKMQNLTKTLAARLVCESDRVEGLRASESRRQRGKPSKR